MSNRFLQIHFLTSYPATLLNRDDAGFAKRIPFGGVTRTRVSSQCLKRHWRTFEGEHALKELAEPSIRSRLTFERYIVQPITKEGVDETLARAATEAVMAEVLGKSAKAKKKETESVTLETGQITVLGRPEINYLRQLVLRIVSECKEPKQLAEATKKVLDRDAKRNLQAMKLGAGLDAALFGRMVTSDILARGDAAIHVAHAFTVHGEASESDYFSAVDDLLQHEETDSLGSGHIGNTELTSGLFYGYVVVDVPLLVSNLEGCDRRSWMEADRGLAAKVVENLVHLVATVSPGAKLGSTAPYAYAHLVLAECGNSQPRTLANAFMNPVAERPDLLANAYRALGSHLADLDRMYGATTDRRAAAIGPIREFGEVPAEGGIGEVASWAARKVRGE